jgi:hypothetical protein
MAKLHPLMPTAEHPEDDRPTATAVVVRKRRAGLGLGEKPGTGRPGFLAFAARR